MEDSSYTLKKAERMPSLLNFFAQIRINWRRNP